MLRTSTQQQQQQQHDTGRHEARPPSHCCAGIQKVSVFRNPPSLDDEEVNGEEVKHREYCRQSRRRLNGTERDATRAQRLENLFADPQRHRIALVEKRRVSACAGRKGRAGGRANDH